MTTAGVDYAEVQTSLMYQLDVLILLVGSGQQAVVEAAYNAVNSLADALPDDHPFHKRTLDLLERYDETTLAGPNPKAVEELQELQMHLSLATPAE